MANTNQGDETMHMEGGVEEGGNKITDETLQMENGNPGDETMHMEGGVEEDGNKIIDETLQMENANPGDENMHMEGGVEEDGNKITDETLQVEEGGVAIKGNTETDDDEAGCCAYILLGFSWILFFFTIPFSLCYSIKIVQEYERAVIFRMGRLIPEAKGPGLFFILPCVDDIKVIDQRTVSFDVPPQEVLSKDSVTATVDAVVYFRVFNPVTAVVNVENYAEATKLLAATTLRNVLGTKTLAEMLSRRDEVSSEMQESLDISTDPWGVKVERVEIKNVLLPEQLQRAMAAEAEAAREARAKVIAAEGEHNASRALKEAADVMAESPAALQLRYLQTLSDISAEKNSTIIFPLPIDLLGGLMNNLKA